MKFQKTFFKRQVKVWSDFYFDYELMLKLLEPLHKIYKEKQKSMINKQQKMSNFNSTVETSQILKTLYSENQVEHNVIIINHIRLTL